MQSRLRTEERKIPQGVILVGLGCGISVFEMSTYQTADYSAADADASLPAIEMSALFGCFQKEMKAFKRTRFKIQTIIVGPFLAQIIVVQIFWTSDLNQYLIRSCRIPTKPSWTSCSSSMRKRWPKRTRNWKTSSSNMKKKSHHFQKFRRYIQREEFLGQNHVSSAGNRQPLGNPLDDTDDN